MTEKTTDITKPLTAHELEVISWIEYKWNLYHKFPPVGEFTRRFGKSFNVKNSLKNETFRLALANRGIDQGYINPDGVPDSLSADQLAAVAVILDVTDRRSHSSKLKSLGLTTAKWQGWLKNPTFKSYLHDLSTNNFNDALHVAQEGLTHAMEKGDTNAIKFYLELTGRYTGDSGTVQNLKVVLARVVESIQRHVKDPEVIRSITNDFEDIMAGRAIKAVESTPPQFERLI